jgi:hypothetical protein
MPPCTSRRSRRAVASFAVGISAALVGVAAPPAGAAPVETGHACLYSYDGYYRNLALTLDVTPPTDPVVAGDTFAVDVRVAGRMPEWIPVFGYNLGLLQPGSNAIPTTIWVALEATGTAEGTQVVQIDVDALTEVDDPDGTPNGNESGTPPTIDVSLPPVTWTSTGGPVEVRQAPAGSLSEVGVPDGEGGTTNPTGTVYMSAAVGDVPFALDCQPGEYTENGESFSPSAAPLLATITSTGEAAPSPSTSTSTTATSSTELAAAPADDDGDGGGSAAPLIIGGIVVLVVVGAVGAVVAARRPSADQR